jgi:hypothetical protein
MVERLVRDHNHATGSIPGAIKSIKVGEGMNAGGCTRSGRLMPDY